MTLGDHLAARDVAELLASLPREDRADVWGILYDMPRTGAGKAAQAGLGAGWCGVRESVDDALNAGV